VLISSSQGYKVDGSKTQKITCHKCRNTSEHELFAFPKGIQLGFIWIPQKYKLGAREYYLKCPICDNLNGPVDKDLFL
jgi:hypothetical protein